jgi:hypothetical protein
VPDSRRRYLARQHPVLRSSDVDEYLSAQAISVLPVADRRHMVVVANGRDGFAVRDASGRWERVGFGLDEHGHRRSAVPLAGNAWVLAPEAVLSILVGLLVLAVGASRICVDRGRDVDGALTAVIFGLLVGLSGAAGLAAPDTMLDLAAAPVAAVGTLLTAVGVGVLMHVAERAMVRPRSLLLVAVVGIGTTGAMSATFWAWTAGLMVDYRPATIMAMVVALGGTSLAAKLAGPATSAPAFPAPPPPRSADGGHAWHGPTEPPRQNAKSRGDGRPFAAAGTPARSRVIGFRWFAVRPGGQQDSFGRND